MSRHTCRWCGQQIRWLTTERGKPMCVDPQPDPAGNVALLDTPNGPRAHALKRDELAEWKGQRWMPHGATCTHMPTRIGTKRTT